MRTGIKPAFRSVKTPSILDIVGIDDTNVAPTKVCKECGGVFTYDKLHYKDNFAREPRSLCKGCSRRLDREARELRRLNPPPEPSHCPGCNVWMEKKDMRLHHSHKTGKFLCYVCDKCNLSMGCANDDPETLYNLYKIMKES